MNYYAGNDYDWSLSDVAKAYKIIYRFLMWQKKFDELAKKMAPKGINLDPTLMNDPFMFMQAVVAVAEEEDMEDIEQTLNELENIGQVTYDELNWAITVLQYYATMKEQVKVAVQQLAQSTETSLGDIEKFASLIGFKMPTKRKTAQVEEPEEEEDIDEEDYVTEEDLEFARKIAQRIKRD